MFCLMMVLLHDKYSTTKIVVGRDYGGPRIIGQGMLLVIS